MILASGRLQLLPKREPVHEILEASVLTGPELPVVVDGKLDVARLLGQAPCVLQVLGPVLARFNLGLTLLELGRDQEGVAVLDQFVEERSDGVLTARARSLIANPRRARS